MVESGLEEMLVSSSEKLWAASWLVRGWLVCKSVQAKEGELAFSSVGKLAAVSALRKLAEEKYQMVESGLEEMLVSSSA